MSMYTYICGIVPPDDAWKRMKAVRDSCVAAGIAIPVDVCTFFNDRTPDERGVVIDKKGLGEAVTEYKAEMSEGFEVDLTKLPKGVRLLRFYNSW